MIVSQRRNYREFTEDDLDYLFIVVPTDDGGSTELLTVTIGLAADGYVEITGGDLEAGDLVVVGR